MVNTVAVIANGTLALQFGLTGADVEEAADAEEAEAVLGRYLDSGAEIVVVLEELAQGFSEAFRERLARHRGRPLLVYCPSFEQAEAEAGDYVSEVVRPAVGYEIRLE